MVRKTWPFVGLIVAVALAGCTTPTDAAVKAASTSLVDTAGVTATSSVSTGPVSLSITPAGGKSVRPDTPVVVTAAGGTISSVKVTGSDGSTVSGSADDQNQTWRSDPGLAGNVTYTVDATADGPSGTTATAHATFTTLKPKATTTVTVMPGEGAVVGVGMPVIVYFGRPVKNKAAAVKALSVTTTPQVEGAWRWMSSTQVQWRPPTYWKPGTKVVVKAAAGSV